MLKKKKIVMSRKHIVPLLRIYKKYPSLWDPNDKNYKNNFHREKVLARIINELSLNLSVAQLRTRIKNLRTTYVREVNKIIESEKEGDEVWTPRLFWFNEADSFLRPVINPSNEFQTLESSDTIDHNIDSYEDLTTEYQDAASNIKDEIDVEMEPFRDQNFTTEDINIDPLPLTPYTPDVPKPTRPVSDRSEDEFDTFGRHVANHLRSLPLSEAIMAQNFINNYLTQQRLKVLEDFASGSRVTGRQ